MNLLFGSHYTDVMGIYRAYKTKLIRELEFDQNRWYKTPEMVVRHAGQLGADAVGARDRSEIEGWPRSPVPNPTASAE